MKVDEVSNVKYSCFNNIKGLQNKCLSIDVASSRQINYEVKIMSKPLRMCACSKVSYFCGKFIAADISRI